MNNPEINQDYMVLVGRDFTELSAWVNKFMKFGYEPQGGVFYIPHPRKFFFLFAFAPAGYGQAMIRKKETV